MLLDDLQVNAKFCETSEERRGRGRGETEEEEAETDKTAGPHRVHNLQSERLAEEKPLISGNIPSGTQLPRYKTRPIIDRDPSSDLFNISIKPENYQSVSPVPLPTVTWVCPHPS